MTVAGLQHAGRWLLRLIPVWLCALSLPAQKTHAAEPYSAAAVKAAYLYRFTGYVEWPQEALSMPRFTIAVLGADDVAAKLEVLLISRSVKGLPAQVRIIKSLREVADAQLLYVGSNYDGNLEAAIAAIGKHPLLIVTDEHEGLDAGGVINFLTIDRRVRFEVSLASAERFGLQVSAELLSVAARVRGRRLRSEASAPEKSLRLGAAGWGRVAMR